MSYEISGIAFSKEMLETVNLSELKSETISLSHLFIFIGPKPFLLLRAGDYLDQEFIDKYKERGVASLYQLKVTNDELSEQFKVIIRSLKTSKRTPDAKKQKDALLKLIGQNYWQDGEESFLSLVRALFDEFYNLGDEFIKNLQEKSQLVYTRSLLIGTFNVLNSLMLGVHDPLFLKDIFQIAFLLDISLIEGDKLNYILVQTMEKERLTPGEGLLWLMNKGDRGDELFHFKNHPTESYEYAKNYEQYFDHPDLLNLIMYQHEYLDGSGFPRGLSYSVVSDIELIPMFSDALIPFEPVIFKANDGKEILVKALSSSLKFDQEKLPVLKQISLWKAVLDWTVKSYKQLEETVEEVAS